MAILNPRSTNEREGFEEFKKKSNKLPHNKKRASLEALFHAF
jgi:hypothetical protein